jgi:hypothetical protein
MRVFYTRSTTACFFLALGHSNSAIGHLCRLASAQDVGWRCGRSILRYSLDLYCLGAELHLRDSWQSALDCSDLLRSKAGRTRDRCGRRHPYREPSFEKRSDVGVGGRSISSDLFLPRPISINHRQCRADWIFRRQVVAG